METLVGRHRHYPQRQVDTLRLEVSARSLANASVSDARNKLVFFQYVQYGCSVQVQHRTVQCIRIVSAFRGISKEKKGKNTGCIGPVSSSGIQ